MSPIEKLDSVLNFIATSDFSTIANPVKNIHHEFERRKKVPIQYSEFIKILNRLSKDGYLEKSIGSNGANEYELTFDGQVFQQEGGYTKFFNDAKSENRIKKMKDWLLILGTWLTGIGALALVAWEIIKTFCLKK